VLSTKPLEPSKTCAGGSSDTKAAVDIAGNLTWPYLSPRQKEKKEKHWPLLHTCSLGGFVEAIRVLMASLASLSAFFPSFPLVISGRMGLLRCRQTKRLRAAQQNTAQTNKNKSN